MVTAEPFTFLLFPRILFFCLPLNAAKLAIHDAEYQQQHQSQSEDFEAPQGLLASATQARLATPTLINTTLNRKHGRLTSAAVVFKVPWTSNKVRGNYLGREISQTNVVAEVEQGLVAVTLPDTTTHLESVLVSGSAINVYLSTVVRVYYCNSKYSES